jgi:hypothetical protein
VAAEVLGDFAERVAVFAVGNGHRRFVGVEDFGEWWWQWLDLGSWDLG